MALYGGIVRRRRRPGSATSGAQTILPVNVSSTSTIGVTTSAQVKATAKVSQSSTLGVLASFAYSSTAKVSQSSTESVKASYYIQLPVTASETSFEGVLSSPYEASLEIKTSQSSFASVKSTASYLTSAKVSESTTDGVVSSAALKSISKTAETSFNGVNSYAYLRQRGFCSESSFDSVASSLRYTMAANTSETSTDGVKASYYTRLPVTTSETSFDAEAALVVVTNVIKASQSSTDSVKASAHMTALANTSQTSTDGVATTASVGFYANTSQSSFDGVLANPFLLQDGAGSIGDLRLVHSGGSSNESQYYSLGGQISTATNSAVGSQRFAQTTITGCTILHAVGNPCATTDGYGTDKTLYFISGSPNQYQWGTSAPVDIPEAGYYTLGDFASGQLYVYCDGTFPGGNTNEAINIRHGYHEMFDVISPLESYWGITDYRCFYLKNTSLGRAAGVQLWIESQPSVGTTLEIGLDPVGVGDGVSSGVATTVPDERTAPTGVTFSSATIDSPLTLGDMYPGEARAFWIKRELATEVTALTFFNVADIGVAALI